GLILVWVSVADPSSLMKLYVCNPLLRRYLELPPTIYEYPATRLISIMDGNGKDAYKVVFVNSKTIEIYHPSKKSWTIAFVFPKDLKIHTGKTILLCKGFLSCETSKPRGIMVYIIQNLEVKETITLAPLPCWPFWPFKADNLCWSDLIACGSTVILVAASPQHFILWEFEMKNLWSWKEIARMPKLLCSEFLMKPPDTYFADSGFQLCCEHIGVGDYVCFRNRNSTEVIAYNLRQQLWGWLPSCPNGHEKCPQRSCRGEGMGFEPRPDMQFSFPT
ncbi:hypothetical protein KI387_024658, partial [Taxus chinensis]